MLREALKKLTQEQLVSEIVRLYSAMEILERQIIQMSDSIESHKNRIEELKAENTALKQRIKDSEDVCDGSFFSDEEDERDKLIAELQDQHQQDCIKINRFHVTIDTLVDKYSRLRKSVGMD